MSYHKADLQVILIRLGICQRKIMPLLHIWETYNILMQYFFLFHFSYKVHTNYNFFTSMKQRYVHAWVHHVEVVSAVPLHMIL